MTEDYSDPLDGHTRPKTALSGSPGRPVAASCSDTLRDFEPGGEP